METFDAICSRKNVREYQEVAIDPDALHRILEAARRTPSAGNKQRWDFVVITDREKLRELSQVWRGAEHIAGSAATIALVAPVETDQATRESIIYDLGQATTSIMIAAASEGVGSGHSAVEDKALAQKVVGHPDGYSCEYLIGLGYPADRPLAPIKKMDRRPFEDVIHQGGW